MNTMEKLVVKDLSDEELLFVLLSRHRLMNAPRKIELDPWHYAVTVGIGNDHTAEIIIDVEAMQVLTGLYTAPLKVKGG